MSKLRDEIAELVYVYANRRASGFAYPTDQMVANEILDKFREALLSDEASIAAQNGITAYVTDPDHSDEIIFMKITDATRQGISSAIDAITGEDDR